MSTPVLNNLALDEASASPTKKRARMGNFMTPVRRILYRLEWSKSAQKRKGKLIKSSHKTPSNGRGHRMNRSSRHPGLASLPSLSHEGTSNPPPVTPDRPPPYSSRRVNPIFQGPSVGPDDSSDVDDADSHSDTNEMATPMAHSHGATVLASPTPPKRRASTSSRVAIQQEDSSLDAIVVTTLPTHPFSCHEDLLAMSRSELIAVAQALNARLPRRSQIPVGEGVLEAVVRSEIEVLVGIRPPVPMAPRAVKCVQSLSVAMDVDSVHGVGDEVERVRGGMPSPPSSPLAMREKRRKGAGQVGLGLGRQAKPHAALGSGSHYQDEGDAMDATALPLLSPRRFLGRLDELPEPDSDVDIHAYESDSDSGDYYEEDSDAERALADPSNAHVVKKRKVSLEGDYARILAVEPKRTAVGPPRLTFPSSSKFSPLHATPALRRPPCGTSSPFLGSRFRRPTAQGITWTVVVEG